MSDSQHHKPGDLVRLKSQPDSCGAVIAVNTPGPEAQYTLEAVAVFWHLVDLIWIFLFPLLYLARGTWHLDRKQDATHGYCSPFGWFCWC